MYLRRDFECIYAEILNEFYSSKKNDKKLFYQMSCTLVDNSSNNNKTKNNLKTQSRQGI